MSEVMNVPEGWKSVFLNDIVINKTQKASPLKKIPIIDLEHIEQTTGKLIQNSWFEDYPKDKVQFIPNDILFGKLRPYLEKFWFATFEGASTSELLVMESKKDIDSMFTFFLIHTSNFIAHANRYAYGTKMPRISFKDLSLYSLVIPKEIKEQKHIAKILSTLDQAIEATQKLIAKEKNIKKGLMHDLLSNGIDENGKIRSPQTQKYKESELGLIPEGWEVRKLDDLISKVMDYRGRTPLKLGMEWGDGMIPSLSANNVQMGAINFKKETHLGSVKLFEKWMTKGKTKKGDILFTMEAPLGNVASIPDDNKYILSQRVILLRPNTKMNEKYLFYYLMSEKFQSVLQRYASGSTVKGIQYSKLKKINILFPDDISEQEQIANIITTQDKKIETEEKNLAKLKALKKGLMDDLLGGKVRVKV